MTQHDLTQAANLFQSRTGSTGHLAMKIIFDYFLFEDVSIPNGLHRPFSHGLLH